MNSDNSSKSNEAVLALAPKFSCLITCYNREPFIRSVIENAFAQEFAPSLEIVIIDDCSTDRSWEIIQEMVTGYQGPFRVIHHRNTENRGLAGSINQGVALASGDWIVCMEGDDIYPANRCTQVLEAVQKHPDILLIAGSCRNITQDGKPFSFRGYNDTAYTQAADIPESLLLSTPDERKHCALRTPGKPQTSAYGTALSFHRKLYDVFGPIPETPRPLHDPTLELRALMLGSVYGERQIVVDYRMHTTNLFNRTHSGDSKMRQLINGEKFWSKTVSYLLFSMQVNLADMDYCQRNHLSDWPDESFDQLRQQRRSLLNAHQLRYQWWECSWLERVRRIFRYRNRPANFKWWPIIRLVPLPLFALIKAAVKN